MDKGQDFCRGWRRGGRQPQWWQHNPRGLG
jgi:hypothetical protein